MTRGEREAYLRGVREGILLGAEGERSIQTQGVQSTLIATGVVCFLLWASAGRRA